MADSEETHLSSTTDENTLAAQLQESYRNETKTLINKLQQTLEDEYLQQQRILKNELSVCT